MPLTENQLRTLWEKAKQEGFSAQGIRQMFAMIRIEPREMSEKDLHDVLPYVNNINARKFK